MYSDFFMKSASEELSRLKQKKAEITAEIDSRIKNLESILSLSLSGAGGLSPCEALLPEGEIEAAGSFAEAILQVLNRSPGGLRPVDVSRRLEKVGFKVAGDTSLSNRVAGEMGRLRRSGRLVKTSEGLYQLVIHS